MDSLQLFNNTEARIPRTFHNAPLLNLVLAASIISKLTQGKAYLQSPWVPFRPIFGYYPHQPLPSLWYPIDPLIFPSRIYSPLTTNMPQLQPPPLNQQQIIHIHETPPLTGDGDGYEDSKIKYSQSINNYPQAEGTAPGETDSSSSNLDQQAAAPDGGGVPLDNDHESYDQIETASSNQNDAYEPLNFVLQDDYADENDGEDISENYHNQGVDASENGGNQGEYVSENDGNEGEDASENDGNQGEDASENDGNQGEDISDNYANQGEDISENEIPEPSDPYGKPVRNETDYIEDATTTEASIEGTTTEEYTGGSTTMESIDGVATTTAAPALDEFSTTEMDSSGTTESYAITTERFDDIEFNEIDSKPQEMTNPCVLPPQLGNANSDRFDFPNDLQMAEANNVQRRKQRPQNNYDYDYYEDDYAQVPNKRKQRPTQPPRRVQKPQRPYKVQPTRINSKRGQYRPTSTTPYNGYDDDYDFTTQRVKPTRRNNFRRRTTTPSYEFDYYEETRPKEHRRKTNRYGMHRATTPLEDDYDSDRYEDDDYYAPSQKQRVPIRPRQEEEDEETTTDTTTTTTSTSTTETTDTSETDTTGSQKPTESYPYYGNNANANISITYGPPINQGYGPSNGNEHISITYGPPTGQNQNPLDSWYNQYAKSSVLKRIQDLLAPNNFYSPQYEGDKYNYNDNVF